MNTHAAAADLVGKRILVAGGWGFIGRHLCSKLTKLGAKVVAVSRSVQPHEEPQVSWRSGDMKDFRLVQSLFAETSPEIVYQLCGRVDASRDLSLVVPTLENDILTTVNLLLAAAAKPVQRFIMTASLEEPEPGEPPTSPYSVAKMSSNAYARMFGLLYKVPIVILRPYMSYGPGQAEKKVIPYMVRSLLNGDSPRLGSGNRPVDWIYISDVIDGFIAAATASGVEGLTFDLGSGKLATIREVGFKLVQLLKSPVEPAFGALQERPLERVRVADTATAMSKLGWQATTSLEAGLLQTIDWWRRQVG